MFNRNRLSAAIVTVLASAAGTNYVNAQEDAALEEVVVTGIRASAQASMDIKRDSAGVVDAISAEDIGKFPDTNLAESLQRITGVSISRSNGEGSEVTVRGFGPEFNMVTLNGRTMPTGTSYGGGSGADGSTRSGGSRAFNFANLAAENVSAIQVYKTGRASVASGGIGATINIETSKPLEKGGFAAAVGAKAVMDTTNRYNSDITPELNGFVSMTNEDETFGASLAVSYQERDSGYSGITVNNWNIGTWGEDDIYNLGLFTEDQTQAVRDAIVAEHFVNAPTQDGQLYARPNDFRYAFSDTQRERLNGQLTLQYAPTEKLTFTADYTYAQNDIREERGEITNWVQNGGNIDQVVFDDSAIATPLTVSECYGYNAVTDACEGTVDIGYEQQYRAQEDTLRSFGFNVDFEVNDALTLVFDYHNSSMESRPTGPMQSGEVAIGLGAPSVHSKTLDFSGDVPVYRFDTAVENDALTEDHVGSSIFRARGSGSVNDIDQIRLEGNFELNDSLSFDFGVEKRVVEMVAYQTSGRNQAMGDWGIANPGELADTGLLEQINIQNEFDSLNVGGSPDIGFRGNANEIARYLVRLNSSEADGNAPGAMYPTTYLDVEGTNSFSDILEEDVTALFAQATFSTEIGGMEANLVGGIRFEDTSVESTSLVNPIPYLVWENNNDFSSGPAGATVTQTETASYDNVLPSIDFDLAVTEDIKVRASYSTTIGRPGYGNLKVAPGNFGADGATLNGYQPIANSSNPGLLPLESANLDLSVEWYFGETSYASVGIFQKDVENFIGTVQEIDNHFGIRDQTNGPRARAAAATLDSNGLLVDNDNLFAQMVFDIKGGEAITERPDLFPTGEYTGTDAQKAFLGEHPPTDSGSWDIIPEDEGANQDPLTDFLTSKPVNEKEATYDGVELAVQHFFGETGFGVLVNYTIVNGDTEFDDEGDPDIDQFALTGLSDTANIVLMYENYGVQARLAYNWRSDFLTQSNQGSSRNPRYVDEYQQFDINVSYDLTDQISISLEGINITGEDLKQYNRNERMVRFYDDLGARWQLGARYQF